MMSFRTTFKDMSTRDSRSYAAVLMQRHFFIKIMFVTESVTEKKLAGFQPPFKKWTSSDLVHFSKVGRPSWEFFTDI